MEIKLINVNKEYQLGETKVQALRNINFTVSATDFITIAGPSGSGKTTLLNMLGCIDTPTQGSVTFDGVASSTLDLVAQAALRNTKIGIIFQAFNLMPVLDVYENIELPTLIGKKPQKSKDTREWIMHLIEAVGLSDRIHHRPDQLSGGQRQRVAIARALVNRPQLVLADEPTANLDSNTSFRILELVKNLNRTENTAFVFSTHDEDIIKQCDTVIKMRDGAIVENSGGVVAPVNRAPVNVKVFDHA
ncbi:MAG: ABC transporter ATP-binding protein [Pseudomonadota bacterium]